MKDKETVSKGPKKRDPTCLQVLDDIVIPTGTILRQDPGKPDVFSCDVGLVGKLSVTLKPGDIHSRYKRVIA
jgi:hypothetical protein